ncbi:MAG: sigma-70 family RNA polymerase sigma factor [Chloroflexi bacterium AL-W]|nr:sigma-70 family RNA polymerase sigma factor [Chloroflexi bacterium AL-N1]NOK68954.1 sigma-70 family RNA polymerase sigma factor [Chloroflexi bacterium AL-N10]NOK76937.1 sigma-70 family RNA polymerase sigma factor [Chloroflexi bacterium AL-N5]NOK82675.1 sigma-70 family RNA polymerase sigma factor [Chloroflexi bacterium AL-W]NOK90794.1 sigma-70 family RNA polymerase sigma factor [Chloroflexi bacterium AL-N15]
MIQQSMFSNNAMIKVLGGKPGTQSNIHQLDTTIPEHGPPEQLDLPTLVKHCIVESELFYRGKTNDSRFAFELFRRALVERNEVAWEYLYNHYAPLVESWVRRSGAFANSGESSEYFVVLAFTRLWRAITPERFDSFPNLASLLQYLQRCAGCVVVDMVRSHSWGMEILPEEAVPIEYAHQVSPDVEAVERISREEFWKYIDAQLHTSAEQIVVFETFIMGMKPGDVLTKYPDLFTCINDVYNVKRNVLGRLGRNHELRRLLAS